MSRRSDRCLSGVTTVFKKKFNCGSAVRADFHVGPVYDETVRENKNALDV